MSDESAPESNKGEPSQQASDVASDVVKTFRDSANRTQQALDDGISVASDAVKNGAVIAQDGYTRAVERSQTFIDTGIAHTQATLDQLFDKLKEGVELAVEHPAASYAAGITLAFLIIPGPRRFLWRQTLGRLRSEEALYKAAEVKAHSLTVTVDSQAAESQKLQERLAAAQEQYSAGLSKLKATNRQLQSLASQVASTERGAKYLIDDLRELPSSQALKLRSDVANQLSAAKRQRAALDRQIYNLSKKGF